MKALVIIFSLIALLVGCGKSVVKSDLAGTYFADYAVASETLILTSNGRFVQRVTVKSDSKILEANGMWKYDAANGQVSFSDSFLSVLDGFGRPYKAPEHGNTILPVVCWFGAVQIGDDPSIEYKKQPNVK